MFCFTISVPILKCDLMKKITCFLFPNVISSFHKINTTLIALLTRIYHIRADQVDMKTLCHYRRQECLCNRVPEQGTCHRMHRRMQAFNATSCHATATWVKGHLYIRSLAKCRSCEILSALKVRADNDIVKVALPNEISWVASWLCVS